MDGAYLRRVNLIEILSEEAEERGISYPELPGDAPHTWTEQQIRDHFSAGPCSVGVAAAPVAQAPPLKFDAPDPDVFRRWFPGLRLSNTACASPRWRVLCFPNAGNAEDMYTNEGTGPRRAASPLLEWCRAHGAECLAVQPPGRAMRSNEPCITRPQELARQLLPVVASAIERVPYVVIAHSVGTWNAFELLQQARAAGLPMPRHVFLSAMAAPDIPVAQRPWRRQRDLSEPELQDECRSWNVNEVVFSKALWPTYHELMRSDFRLFDEYEFEHEGAAPFEFPIKAFNGSVDRKISASMVSDWARFTSGGFCQQEIAGHHLWPLDRAAKLDWLSSIVAQLEAL